jgi:hypothetical protein
MRDDPDHSGFPEGAAGDRLINPTTGRPWHRRVSERRIDRIAESSLLKVLQFVVVALFVPFAVWFGARTLSDIDDVKRAVNLSTIQSATFELRVQQLEKAGIETSAAIRMLTEQSLKNNYETRRLEDRVSIGRPSPER